MSDIYILRNAIQDLLRVKKLITVAVVTLLPVLVALIWHSVTPSNQYVASAVYNKLSESLIFGFILVILACVFCTSVVSQEVEQKTIVYLLTRPVPRWRILLMKFIAAFLATVISASVASVLLLFVTYGTQHWGQSTIGRDLCIIPFAGLAYGGIFLLLSTLVNRPLIAGLMYAFGVETWLPNMPGNFKMLSLMAYIRTLAPHTQQQADQEQSLGNLLSAAFTTPDLTVHLAWIVVTIVTIIGIFGAMVVFSNKEYVPKDEI